MLFVCRLWAVWAVGNVDVEVQDAASGKGQSKKQLDGTASEISCLRAFYAARRNVSELCLSCFLVFVP